ncbi:unnamed protein product [Adineta ricciae]|uniref:Uncharacterized protein n=1 Tax=Adineta ricciae TaxID=249248 RepID=A0A814FDF3_ADIRI|nr:unnamed protein product [Adineta ricciae]CAF1054135.1 unnamed protein product [Adineta ricciae]
MYIELSAKRKNHENVDDFINSFRSYFWLEKHHWYIRSHYYQTSHSLDIYLYTLPYVFNDLTRYVSASNDRSTLPQALNSSHHYDRVHTIKNAFILRIQVHNIRNLTIDLPFNDRLFEFLPTFHRLNSLTVSSRYNNADRCLQLLLDRAPCLYSLSIKSWPDSQTPIVGNTSPSLRRLDLRMAEYTTLQHVFTVEECKAIAEVSLGWQCEELLIRVNDHNSIRTLLNLPQLRLLNVLCRFYQPVFSRWELLETNVLLEFLRDSLPPSHILLENNHSDSIWICRK